jgi:hypothetical protein
MPVPIQPGQIVKKAWDDFATKTIPPDASEIQHTESRRMFYAGWWASLSLFMRIGGEDVPEDTGVEWLSSVKAELESFYQDVKEGRA